MKPTTKGTIARYGKFLLCNIPGTAVDLLVVWSLSRFSFNGYWGQYIGAPAISYECGILVDFVLCYFFVWGDHVSRRTVGSFFRHLLGYNLSSIGAYFSKALVIALLGVLTARGLDVVWCDFIAMTFSGSVNFLLNERFIFRKKNRNNEQPMNNQEFIVSQPTELLPFLLQSLPGLSRTKVKEILGHSVAVDGRRTSQFNYPLAPGARVTIGRPNYKERFRNRCIDIVYEDQWLVVINKHEGVLSNSKNPNDETAIKALNQYFRYTHQQCNAHIVHRLDRDTSGLMIVSKDKQVSRRFEEDWKGYVYNRAYVAVCWGQLEEAQGTYQSWLTDGQYCVLSSPTDNGGKLAVTHYKTLRTSRRYSLLELTLDTGRRNQIRVHLRELKHPVVHDPMYGYKDDISPVSRLCLHAYRLHFRHPITGRDLKFETPVPSSFEKLLEI